MLEIAAGTVSTAATTKPTTMMMSLLMSLLFRSVGNALDTSYVWEEQAVFARPWRRWRQGYSGVEASNPVEALAICEEDRPFDLLVTDVVMPTMNGRELACKVRELLDLPATA